MSYYLPGIGKFDDEQYQLLLRKSQPNDIGITQRLVISLRIDA